MALHVLLTVDLNHVKDDAARKTFGDQLAKEHWKKIGLTTTWYASFSIDFTRETALAQTANDVKAAAAVAGIQDYEAAAQAGEGAPQLWNSKRQ